MGRKRDLISKTASKVSKPLSRTKRKERFKKSPRLIIVMLHHITAGEMPSDESREITITAENLRKYLEFLKNNYQICTLHEAEKLIRRGAEGPFLVLSFDDGYTDFYENVFPVLKELGLSANQNLIVKYTDEAQPGYMNWAEVKELFDSGLVEFGCHTYDKHYLVDEKAMLSSASEEEVISDLEKARESFTKNLGFSPDILAWPYGEKPRSISDEKLHELGFKFCLNTKSGVNFRPVKFMDLKRFAALDFETPEKLGDIIEGYDNLGFLLGKH
ncbi:MAG: polysaccharide deacetylase family protein [Candidatus Saccharibacteria bacterium]|nr:polysaccharide deacetylase family protein [Candidatus Saccharibacteria bacterium]